MEIHQLPAEEAAVRRFTEELWLPYNRDLEAVVEGHALAEDVDVVAEDVEFRLDLLESESYRAWVAVEGAPDGGSGDEGATDEFDFAAGDGDPVGFVTTELDEAPPVFEWPDRLIVGDVYVQESHRGTGLADDLMARAVERARAAGCSVVELDVDAGNERAIAFYERLGFETRRRRMAVGVEELSGRVLRETASRRDEDQRRQKSPE